VKDAGAERPSRRTALGIAGVVAANVLIFSLLVKDYRNPILAFSAFRVEEMIFRAKTIQKGAAYKDATDSLIMRTSEQPGIRAVDQIHCISPFPQDKTMNRFEYFWHLDVPSLCTNLPPLDLHKDGRPLLPTLAIEKGRLRFSLFDLNGNVKREIALPDPSVPIPPINDAFISWLDIADLDGNGKPALVLAINGQFSGLPRGLLAYDALTGGKRFEFLIGALPYQTRLVDLNADGRMEIVLSAWAPHNGLASNGVDDDHSHLFVLDSSGHMLWQKVVGQFFTKVSFDIADLDADGRLEIITARACHRAQNPDLGEIIVFDALTGEPRAQARYEDISFSEVRAAPLANGQAPSIVVGDSQGRLRVFDGSLRLQRETQGPGALIVLGIGPLGRDPAPLIFACSKTYQFLIYDGDLRKVYGFRHREIEYLDPPRLLSLSDRGNQHLVFNADNLYRISRSPKGGLAAATDIVFSSLTRDILLLLLFNALAYTLFRGRAGIVRLESEARAQDKAADSVSIVQEIVHRLKSPLFTVQLEADKLAEMASEPSPAGRADDIARISRSIREDVKTMDRLAHQIMQLIRPQKAERKTADLGPFLRSVISKYAGHQDGRVEYRVDLPDQPILMTFDAVQLREALDIIIENALEAMPQGGRVRLAACLIASPSSRQRKRILLEIEDTGHGIPEDSLPRVLDLFFTTKKEGLGLGLPLAKRIIEAHGGTLEVASREGIGTTIAMTFPWKDPD